MPDNTSTSKTLASFSEMLARAAGALVGLSALAYFVGYEIESNYLSQVGARWALGMFSTSELVQKGLVIIIPAGLTLFLSIVQLFETDGAARKLGKIDITLNIISVMLLIGAFVSSKYFENPKFDYTLSLLAGMLFAAAAGFTLGELIGRLDESKRIWDDYHFYLIFCFYFSAGIMAPHLMGKSSAKLDIDPSTTALPLVAVDGEEAGKWRLMRIIGDKYFLVVMVENPSSRKFRLVPISSSLAITGAIRNEHK